jgi:hypothetical protein
MTTARPSLDPDLEPAAGRILEGYLATLAARLPGPSRTRQAILAELGDGLADATQAYYARGLGPAAAAQAAVAEFGQPPALAAAFAPELAGAQARQTALALIRSGPLIGGLWLGALVASNAAPWRHGLTGIWLALPAVAVAIAAAGLAALLVVAATGRASRWLPTRLTLAPAAAAIVGAAAIGVDLVVLGMLTGQAIIQPGTIAWIPVGLAALASLTRLVLASCAARRSLAARAALT